MSVAARMIGAAVMSCAVMSAALLAASSLPAHAANSADAVIAWSMVPQAKDADGDGFIDGDGGVPKKGALSSYPSARMIGAGNHVAQPNERLINGNQSWYLNDRGFPVSLDACASRGDKARWTVLRNGEVAARLPWKPLSKKHCSREVVLPEGTYELQLEVRGSGQTSRTKAPAQVVNYLTVAMGDSYASGEGNPRNVDAWLTGSGGFSPYWDDSECHRSVHGGPAQAALRLEESSPHSSVTFIDLACSGATVAAGILGPQTAAGQSTSQMQQARSIVGDLPVDIVLLMVGGNDIGFTSILASCALVTDCPVSKAVTSPLNRYPTVQQGVQTLTGGLTRSYARIAQCLADSACGPSLSPGAAVLPVMYPDITRATDGAPCTYLTLSQGDFGWARDTVLVPSPAPAYDYVTSSGQHMSLGLAQGTLNGQIAATGSMLGWHPVQRAWAASGDSAQGHGVCADDPWAFALTALSAMPDASFHPNPAGHLAMGKAISGAIEIALK